MNDQVQGSTVATVAKLKKIARFEVDGKQFDTQKEASEYLRRHLVVEAVNAVASSYDGTSNLGEFLLANRDSLVKAYDAAKVERPPVTEETKQKMKAVREMSPEQRAAHKAARDAEIAAAKEARKAAKAAKTVAA